MALAQTTVTGKVVSQEDGEPVIGASVKIAGTKTGTVTDVDGNFTLPNASKDAVLEVTYLGMEPKKVKASAKMKIMLVADSRNLDEVVVTAMGISRSSKALGYSAAVVGGEKISESRTNDVMSSLAGKVAVCRFLQHLLTQVLLILSSSVVSARCLVTTSLCMLLMVCH